MPTVHDEGNLSRLEVKYCKDVTFLYQIYFKQT